MNKLSILFITLLLVAGVSAQGLETRIFVLKARPAESTVELVKPLLSPNGFVAPESRLNKLIVRDTPQVILEVEELLNEIDVYAPQVRVYVDMNGVGQSQASLTRVAVGVNNPRVGVAGQTGLGRTPNNNRRVGVAGTAAVTRTQSTTRSQQNLLIQSGERGVIHFARQVANPNPLVQFALANGLITPDLAFQSVGSGIAVEPVVVGENVRLRVSPWMSFLGPAGATNIQVSEAASSFTVRSGDSITISAAGYNDQFRDRSFGLIFSSGGASSSANSSIVLRPVISDMYKP